MPLRNYTLTPPVVVYCSLSERTRGSSASTVLPADCKYSVFHIVYYVKTDMKLALSTALNINISLQILESSDVVKAQI